jgi:hypothetical protein
LERRILRTLTIVNLEQSLPRCEFSLPVELLNRDREEVARRRVLP